MKYCEKSHYTRGLIIDLLPSVNNCYFRHPVIKDGQEIDMGIPVLRFLCKKCGKTVSCLPSFATPFKHYSSDSICACLHEIHHLGESVQNISTDNRAIPVRTIMEWKGQWALNTPLLFQDGLTALGFTSSPPAIMSCYDQLVYNALATNVFPQNIPKQRSNYCSVFANVQPKLCEKRIGLFRPLLPV